MDIHTNDQNVALWVIAWEICKKIKSSTGVEGETFEENSEEWAYQLAGIVKKTFEKLRE